MSRPRRRIEDTASIEASGSLAGLLEADCSAVPGARGVIDASRASGYRPRDPEEAHQS